MRIGDGGTTGGLAGDIINNGLTVFDRSDDFDFLGDFSGTGALTKLGAGTLTFAGGYSYTGTTSILGGTIRFAGELDPETELDLQQGTADLSGTDQTIALLSGKAGTGLLIEDATLTIDQSGDSQYAGGITGNGSLTKAGSGHLDLTGASDYTGPTTLLDGTLSVNGSIQSVVTVAGGTLGGNGTVGGIVAGSGGAVGPGNSIGQLDVAGNVSFGPGSVYQVEVDATGATDLIAATGTASIDGATMAVMAENGRYRGRTEYTVLTAAGGVSGAFGSVTSDLAFLTPTLAYTATSVVLSLTRNDIDFAALATSRNQVRSAAALEALGIGDTLFEAVLAQDAPGARMAFDTLSGEVHAHAGATLVQDGRYVRDALLAAPAPGGDGFGLWGQALRSDGDANANATRGSAALSTRHDGLIAGFDFRAGEFAIGVAAGKSDAAARVDARASEADTKSRFVGGRFTYASGGFGARGGVAFAWHEIATSRGIAFPSFTESVQAAYDGTTRQIFGEVSWDLGFQPLTLEPFARLAHVRVHTDAFAEAGGTAAVSGQEQVHNVQLASLGARIGGQTSLGSGVLLTPRLSLAWQKSWGDRVGTSRLRFNGAASDFSIEGAELAGSALAADAGIGIEVGHTSFALSYSGSIADRWEDHAMKGTIGFRF